MTKPTHFVLQTVHTWISMGTICAAAAAIHSHNTNVPSTVGSGTLGITFARFGSEAPVRAPVGTDLVPAVLVQALPVVLIASLSVIVRR
jgi:hypothetical protein